MVVLISLVSLVLEAQVIVRRWQLCARCADDCDINDVLRARHGPPARHSRLLSTSCRSETSQVTAKAALTQMVNVVFQRLAAGDVVQERLNPTCYLIRKMSTSCEN
jgi:hypothetical protein